jgi:hypothetical protein
MRMSNLFFLYVRSQPDMRMGGVSAPIANYSLKNMRDARIMEYL